MGSSKQRARERVAQMRIEQRRRQRRSRIRWGLATGVLVLVVAGLITASVLVGGNQAISGVRTFDDVSRGHVQGQVDYEQTPPVGGKHNPVWLNCGIYTSPVENKHAVHALEHGAVWITYRPDLPDEQVQRLRDAARGRPFVLLSPYPDLPAPVVSSAWGKQLQLDDASDGRLDEFLQAYVQGPQTPEPNAACSGGTGTPKA